MRAKWILSLLTISLIGITPVYASPTLNGPTGLIEVPTAESLKYKEFNLAFDYGFSTQGSGKDIYFYKVNIGTFKGWEIGAVGGKRPDEGVFVNVKYHLLSEDTRYPLALAIGAQNLTSNNDTSLYLTASKKFKGGFHGHFGFIAEFDTNIDAAIMGGLEYFITDEWSILTDILGENDFYRWNVGGRYFFNDYFSFRASVIDIFDNQSKNPSTTSQIVGRAITAGVSWSRFF